MVQGLTLADCLFCKYSFIATQPHPSFMYCLGCTYSLTTELSSCNRPYGLQSSKGLLAPNEYEGIYKIQNTV